MKTHLLDCLVETGKLIEQNIDSAEQLLQEVVNLLTETFSFSESTSIRITHSRKEYTSPHFKPSKWYLSAGIIIDGKATGSIEIHYLKSQSDIINSRYFDEERLLINTLAKNLGTALERIRLKYYLQARGKALNCLYRMTKLIEKHSSSIDKILQGIVYILSESLQISDRASVRIIIGPDEYKTDNFAFSQMKQSAEIKTGKNKIGILEVYYHGEVPLTDEGPFLKEEQLLITAITERIGRAIERIKVAHQLKIERLALESKNIALHELVEMVQKEKDYVGVSLQNNVDKIIMPIIHAMETDLPKSQHGYVKLLKKNLMEIASPFTNNISEKFSALSPVEIQICNLVKNGFMTKEIAQIRGISPATVNRHREHIRKKLGLSNQKINLTTYLNSLST